MNSAIWGGGSKGAGYSGGGHTLCAPTHAAALLGGLDTVKVTYADCYVVHAGRVAFSGGNVTGVVGEGFRSVHIVEPRIIPIREPVADFAVAGARWLALGAESGQPITCGSNTCGQLGDGTSGEGHEKAGSTVPVYLDAPGSPIVAVLAGGGVNGLLRADGSVQLWGEGKRGQLGYGIMPEQRTPRQVPGLFVKALSLGGDSSLTGHGLGLTGEGVVLAWGDNNQGQCGQPLATTEVPRHGHCVLVPTPVPGLPPIIAVAAGSTHSLALDTEGNVWVWGANGYGQLGLPTSATGVAVSTPTKIPLPGPARAISAGLAFSMVLLADGTPLVFGFNLHGVLDAEFGEVESSPTPTPVGGISGAAVVDAGEWSAACVCAGPAPGPRGELLRGLEGGQLGLSFEGDPASRYVAAFRQQSDLWAEREEWSEASRTVVPPGAPHRVTWSGLEAGPYEAMVRGPGLGQMVFEGTVA